MVNAVAVGQHHFQFAIGHIGFGMACVFAFQVAATGAGLPQRLLAEQGVDHGLGIGLVSDALQCTLGGKEDKQLFLFKARNRILRRNPGGLELLGFVGHRRLTLGHAGHKERHVKALGQVQWCGPVGQIPELVHGQRPAARAALLIQRCLAVQLLNLGRWNGLAGLVIGQQDAQLLKSLANACQSLGDAFISRLGDHAGAHARQRMTGWGCIFIFLAAAGENIGIGKDALICTPCHQHFKTLAVGAVAQQQKRGSIARGNWRALGLKQLAGAGLAG